MSSPLQAATACSRLSPHLAWGTLGAREIIAHLTQTTPHPIGAANLQSFTARLAWRDHFMQKLEDQPGLEFSCLHSAYADLRPKTPDAALLAAWEKGETGIPFVDACMRSLTATGWINFRMRAMLVSFASYHLWLDWRATGQILARRFTDYEPGIHWPQMQMQSGTTGMNTPRIYNPVKQGHDQDPTGSFTRRWCPELRDLPDTHLHSPWTWPGANGLLDKTYPAPIIDIAAAARHARTPTPHNKLTSSSARSISLSFSGPSAVSWSTVSPLNSESGFPAAAAISFRESSTLFLVLPPRIAACILIAAASSAVRRAV